MRAHPRADARRKPAGPRWRASACLLFELGVLECENLRLAGVDIPLPLRNGVAQCGPIPFVELPPEDSSSTESTGPPNRPNHDMSPWANPATRSLRSRYQRYPTGFTELQATRVSPLCGVLPLGVGGGWGGRIAVGGWWRLGWSGEVSGWGLVAVGVVRRSERLGVWWFWGWCRVGSGKSPSVQRMGRIGTVE